MISKPFLLLFLTLCFVPRTELIDLGNACKNMWLAAGNNLITAAGPNQELTVQIPAANPLFTVVQGGGGPGKIASLPFTRFDALLGDYQVHPPAPTNAHITDFLDELVQPGGPVGAAFNYLRVHGALPAGVNNFQEFRAHLEDIWFTASTGFQHVFVGEQYTYWQNGQLLYKGFHNWYQFMVEQGLHQTANINQGMVYSPNTRPAFLSGLRFRWRGSTKNAGSSMFVGTSPAFDLAMFSTCFIKGMIVPLVNDRVTNCDCHIDVGGRRNTVQIRVVEKIANAGKVCTAFPTNVQSVDICTANALQVRLDCGYHGITKPECEDNRGCCWDDTIPNVNWCFRSDPDLADRCRSIDVPARVDCGWVTEAECLANNCCWDDLQYNNPSIHCFNPHP